jgi:Fur family transcriptional regulator, peroxide stress response regulator
MHADTKILSKMLIEKNIRPSFQRIGILAYMASKKSHPTADEIYNFLVKKIPHLSRTTVYNTLHLFLKSGLACPVSIEGKQARYDIVMQEHGHFKCTSCRTIYDFDADLADISKNIPEDFKIHEKNIFFKGICSQCLNDINKK